jgi:tRNA-Thr(GGU) m(6)t(6)A37 methyltransferase TsaA
MSNMLSLWAFLPRGQAVNNRRGFLTPVKLSGFINFIGFVEKVEGELSTILIHSQYAPGLDGLDAYKTLYILYWLHEADNPTRRATLRVVPRRHGATEERGVFSTHSPHRPNPVGLTTVELVKLEGNRLTVRGLDAFEGSPIVDIKPEEHN